MIFTNVLRTRKGLSQAELSAFRAGSMAEVIPKTCSVPGNSIGFNRGMSYTFVYESIYGEHLAEFSVDKAMCAPMRR